MRIWPEDIRYADILKAPPSPPCFPGRMCPIHNHVHEWRVIDFEYAEETNIPLEKHARWTESCQLARILSGLRLGFYYDPEEI